MFGYAHRHRVDLARLKVTFKSAASKSTPLEAAPHLLSGQLGVNFYIAVEIIRTFAYYRLYSNHLY